MVPILHAETLFLWDLLCPFGRSVALAHLPIMMPENARTRAATRAEVTTERINERGRWGSGVGDTGRQVPMGH